MHLAGDYCAERACCSVKGKSKRSLIYSTHAYIQLACAAARGFAIIEGDSTLRYLATPLEPEDEPYVRFNDGACDSKGRFLAGTICGKNGDVPGRLYMYDPHENTCTLIDPGPFTVGNAYSLPTCNILGRSPWLLFLISRTPMV